MVLWSIISPPSWEIPRSIPNCTKEIHDIYGTIWEKILCLAEICAAGWFSWMVDPEPIVYLACVSGRKVVFRIICTFDYNLCAFVTFVKENYYYYEMKSHQGQQSKIHHHPHLTSVTPAWHTIMRNQASVYASNGQTAASQQHYVDNQP